MRHRARWTDPRSHPDSVSDDPGGAYRDPAPDGTMDGVTTAKSDATKPASGPRIVIIGGGPAGYESALVAAQLGARVTVVDRDGIGGSCVLTDCVPSKTLIATSDRVTAFRDAPRVGVGSVSGEVAVDLASVNERIKDLARQQSEDIGTRMVNESVTVIPGAGRFSASQPPRAHRLEVVDASGAVTE